MYQNTFTFLGFLFFLLRRDKNFVTSVPPLLNTWMFLLKSHLLSAVVLPLSKLQHLAVYHSLYILCYL